MKASYTSRPDAATTFTQLLLLVAQHAKRRGAGALKLRAVCYMLILHEVMNHGKSQTHYYLNTRAQMQPKRESPERRISRFLNITPSTSDSHA